MNSATRRLAILFLIFSVTSCQENIHEIYNQNNLSLENFNNPFIKNNLIVHWDNSFEIVIDQKNYSIYHTILENKHEIFRDGYKNTYDYFVMWDKVSDEHWVIQAHTNLESETSNPFEIHYLGNTIIFDLNGEVRKFLIRQDNSLQLISRHQGGNNHAKVNPCYWEVPVLIEHYRDWFQYDNLSQTYIYLDTEFLYTTLEYEYVEAPCSGEYHDQLYLTHKVSVYVSFEEGQDYLANKLANLEYNLSICEKAMAENPEYALDLLQLYENRRVTMAKTKELFGYNGRNDCSDAFRHAFFNALNTRTLGESSAKAWGDAHECDVPISQALERDMDLHNNSIGRLVSIEAGNVIYSTLADLILLEIENGNLNYLDPLDLNNLIIPNVTTAIATSQSCL